MNSTRFRSGTCTVFASIQILVTLACAIALIASAATGFKHVDVLTIIEIMVITCSLSSIAIGILQRQAYWIFVGIVAAISGGLFIHLIASFG